MSSCFQACFCIAKALPFVFIVLLIGWSYYAYVVALCINSTTSPGPINNGKTGLIAANNSVEIPNYTADHSDKNPGKWQLIKKIIANFMSSTAYKPDTNNGPLLGNAKNKAKDKHARNRTLASNKVKRKHNLQQLGDAMHTDTTGNGSSSKVDVDIKDTKVPKSFKEDSDNRKLVVNGSAKSADKHKVDADFVIVLPAKKTPKTASRRGDSEPEIIPEYPIYLTRRDKSNSKENSRGKSKSGSRDHTKSDSRSDSRGDTKSDSRGDTKSDSRGDTKSDSRGDTKSDSRGDSKSDFRGESKSDSRGESKSDSRGESKSNSKDESKRDSRGESNNNSRDEFKSDTRSESMSDSPGESKRDSRGESKRDFRGESKSDSRGKSKSDSSQRGESKSDSRDESKSDIRGDSKISKKGDSSQPDWKGKDESSDLNDGPGFGSKADSQRNRTSDNRRKLKNGSIAIAKSPPESRNVLRTESNSELRMESNGDSGKVSDKITQSERKQQHSQVSSKKDPNVDADSAKLSNLTTSRTENRSISPQTETLFPAEFKVDTSLDTKNDSHLDEKIESVVKNKTNPLANKKDIQNSKITLAATGTPDTRFGVISNSTTNSTIGSLPESRNISDLTSKAETLINPKPKSGSGAGDKPKNKTDSSVDPESKKESRDDSKGESKSDSKVESKGDSSKDAESKKESRDDSKGESKSQDPKADSKSDDSRSDSREEPKGSPHDESKGKPHGDSHSESDGEPHDDLRGDLKDDSKEDTGAAKIPAVVASTSTATTSTKKQSPPHQKPQPPVAVPPVEEEERGEHADYASGVNIGGRFVLPPPPQHPGAGSGSKLKSPVEVRRSSFDADAGFVNPLVTTSVSASYGSLFAYFVLMMLTLGVLYVACHRKQKILACLIEGRHRSAKTARWSGSRQASGSGYKPLPTEQELPRVPHEKPDSVQNFVF